MCQLIALFSNCYAFLAWCPCIFLYYCYTKDGDSGGPWLSLRRWHCHTGVRHSLTTLPRLRGDKEKRGVKINQLSTCCPGTGGKAFIAERAWMHFRLRHHLECSHSMLDCLRSSLTSSSNDVCQGQRNRTSDRAPGSGHGHPTHCPNHWARMHTP